MKDASGRFVVETQSKTVTQSKVVVGVRDIYEYLKSSGVELPHWELTRFYLEDTDIKSRQERIELQATDLITVWWETSKFVS